MSVAVPTIAFGGATEVPQEAWALVEGLAPAYGDDWWYRGLLAFIRQEQSRWDEAMELATASLAAEPASAHAAHARTHVHYETGDHAAGLAWLDGWITARAGDVAAGALLLARGVARTGPGRRRGRDGALHGPARAATGQRGARPGRLGVAALARAGAGRWDWPMVTECSTPFRRSCWRDPPTPFIALHVAVALAAADDRDGLIRLRRPRSAFTPHPAFHTTIAELAEALTALVDGNAGLATDRLLALTGVASLGGSAAQREVVEETLLFSAVTARRHDVADRPPAHPARPPAFAARRRQLLDLARFPARMRLDGSRTVQRQHRLNP